MENQQIFDIAVVGGGGAGTMAYLRSVLNCDRTIFFLGNSESKRRGRGTWVTKVENIPGLHDMKRPIVTSQKSTLKWIHDQEALRDIGLAIPETVTSIRKVDSNFHLSYENSTGRHEAYAKFVILATGVMDQQPLIQGTMDPVFPFANRGDFIYCIRCDGHRTIGKTLSVLGYDDNAIQIAICLAERYDHLGISIFTNGQTPTFSKANRKIMDLYGMKVFQSPIRRILGNPQSGLAGFSLDTGEEISTECAVVALGTIVYNELAKELGLDLDSEGKIAVKKSYETSLPGVFAVGDVISEKKMQIYTAWDEAVDAADEINRRLRLAKRERRLHSMKSGEQG